MKKVLLIADVDGVLNAHEFNKRTMRTAPAKANVDAFNELMEWCHAKWGEAFGVVLSSAWRYNVHRGWMTLEGLGELFATHGVWFPNGLYGITERDEKTAREQMNYNGPTEGAEWFEWIKANGQLVRAHQVYGYVYEKSHEADLDTVESYICIDDLALPISWARFWQTDGDEGLTEEHVDGIKTLYSQSFEQGGHELAVLAHLHYETAADIADSSGLAFHWVKNALDNMEKRGLVKQSLHGKYEPVRPYLPSNWAEVLRGYC